MNLHRGMLVLELDYEGKRKMLMLKRYAPFIISVLVFTIATILFAFVPFHWFFLSLVWPLYLYGWAYIRPTPISNFLTGPLMALLYFVILFFPLFLFGLTRKKIWFVVQALLILFVIFRFFTYGVQFFESLPIN